MRALVLALALLTAVAWDRTAAAASVAVDLVAEHLANDVGDRDVWGLWLRTSPGVQVSSLSVFVNLGSYFESVAIDVSNPNIDLSDIQPDILGDSIPLLFAAGFGPTPLVGSGASGRIATITGPPLEAPPHVIIVPELIPFENVYEYPSIDPTNGSGSPLSILSLSGPTACLFQAPPCEIPKAPSTHVRWLWELPEPRAGVLLAATLALLALRRRA